jgi:hypothetical protein
MGKAIGGLFGLDTEAPKAPMKSMEQLTAEQNLKQDAFSQKAKGTRKASAIQASLTQDSLTGGLGNGTVIQDAELTKLEGLGQQVGQLGGLGRMLAKKRVKQLSGK